VKRLGGGGECNPRYSIKVEDHTYGVISFALDNLCPSEISHMLRGIFCLLGQKNESLFIRPKK
jgi:hypothetical protein